MIDIQLRNVTVHESLSEETYAYHAVVVVDGRDFMSVKNHGHGGADQPTMFFPPFGPKDLTQVEQRVAAEHPKMDMSAYGMADADATLEGVCHQLVDDFLMDRDIAKLLKNKVAFYADGLPTEGSAPLLTVAMQRAKGPRPADTVEGLKAWVLKQHPQAFFLNGLPQAELREAYKRANVA